MDGWGRILAWYNQPGGESLERNGDQIRTMLARTVRLPLYAFVPQVLLQIIPGINYCIDWSQLKWVEGQLTRLLSWFLRLVCVTCTQ